VTLPRLPAPTHLNLVMLNAANALLRVAGSAAGQLFALELATRHAGSASVALVGACFYAAELLERRPESREGATSWGWRPSRPGTPPSR
jgi:hypothetical protein